MISAFSISMSLKQHPMIWSSAVSVQDQFLAFVISC